MTNRGKSEKRVTPPSNAKAGRLRYTSPSEEGNRETTSITKKVNHANDKKRKSVTRSSGKGASRRIPQESENQLGKHSMNIGKIGGSDQTFGKNVKCYVTKHFGEEYTSQDQGDKSAATSSHNSSKKSTAGSDASSLKTKSGKSVNLDMSEVMVKRWVKLI